MASIIPIRRAASMVVSRVGGIQSRTVCSRKVSVTVPSRSISSTPRFYQDQQQPSSLDEHDFKAAPEIDFDVESAHQVPLLERVRVVPASPAYFSARPNFTDDYVRVEELWLKYKILPRIPNRPSIKWPSFEEMKASAGSEPIRESRHREMIKRLKELSAIEPVVMPLEVQEVLDKHIRAHQTVPRSIKVDDVDEWGRSSGVGKRKESTAKAYLVMGEGEVLVNSKPITQMFGRLHDRESVLWPLKITDRLDKYNLFAIVRGGGVTGQAEALTLAVAKALVGHEPQLERRLLEAGCLYRDPRVVERKKPGHLKARKKPAWVKR